jgi:hypothetical protein
MSDITVNRDDLQTVVDALAYLETGAEFSDEEATVFHNAMCNLEIALICGIDTFGNKE